MDYKEKLEDLAINYDNLSKYEAHKWSHNTRYLPSLLKDINKLIGGYALDVFSQRGELARTLSPMFSKVIGLDLSPKMVEKAQERSKDCKNVQYYCADFMEYNIPESSCGLVTMVACLHHFPTEEALSKAKWCLKRGGRLIVVDMYRPSTIGDIVSSLISAPLNRIGGALLDRPKASAEEMAQWKIHASLDSYSTISEIKNIAQSILPNAKIKRRLFWRYSLVWVKP